VKNQKPVTGLTVPVRVMTISRRAMMSEVAEKPKSREMAPQPLELINVSGAMLNIRTVELVVGFKKTKINEEVKAGRFPKPERHSPTCSRWLSDKIKSYLATRRDGRTWSEQQ
jgi:predicted DNA-binding transcriptional regulator AlpA